MRSWATISPRKLTKQMLKFIDGDMVIGTPHLGFRKLVTKWVLISGGTWMTKFQWTHQEPSKSHTHILPVPVWTTVTSLIWSSGSRCGAAKWKTRLKTKWKTLETTKISKMLSAKIILKLKSWAWKFSKLESHLLNYKLESKIFQLDSRWSESH